MLNGFEYPKEIPGDQFPPHIIGRLELHRLAHDDKVAFWCRLTVCQEHETTDKYIYRRWIYEGEPEPRPWHNFGTVPRVWTVPQVLTMIQVESPEWQLRHEPWKGEIAMETTKVEIEDDGKTLRRKPNGKTLVEIFAEEQKPYDPTHDPPDLDDVPLQEEPPVPQRQKRPPYKPPPKKEPPVKKPSKPAPKRKASEEGLW